MQTRSRSSRRERAADEVAVVEDVVVRERGALGEAGGARGVLDVDRVVERERASRAASASGGTARPASASASQSSRTRWCGAAVGSAAAHLGEHGAVVAGAEGARVDEHAGRRLRERVLDLGGLVGGVEVHEDGADARAGELRQSPTRSGWATRGRRDRRGRRRAARRPRATRGASLRGAGARWRDNLASGRRAPRDRRSGRRCAQRLADGVSEQRRVADAVRVGEHGAQYTQVAARTCKIVCHKSGGPVRWSSRTLEGTMSHAAKKMTTTGHGESTGGRLVTADGRTLALRGATLRADARGGIARVVLEQRFANTFAEPLAVTYLMPLPSDGAVSGYAFTIGDGASSARSTGARRRASASRRRSRPGARRRSSSRSARACSRRRSATSRRAPRWWRS